MNFLNQLKSRLAVMFRKRELDSDMDDEIKAKWVVGGGW